MPRRRGRHRLPEALFPFTPERRSGLATLVPLPGRRGRRILDASTSYGVVEVIEEPVASPPVQRFAEAEDLTGVTLPPCYYIERRHAAGGMSVVYRARHLYLDRACAVKVPQTPTPPMELRRIRREARIGALLDHPHVVRIFDCGLLPDLRPFLVMELLTGPSLRQVMDGYPMDPARACHLTAQVANGLGALHALNVVHRDIKPSNLMLEAGREGLDSDHEHVKIVDLGLSKRPGEAEDCDVTMPEQVLGTPSYMPPEQRRGEDANPASDQWSLGCVLFEMLTGERVISDPDGPPRPPPLHLLSAASVPEPLCQVVRRMLALDPRERFSSITALELELRALCY